MGILAYEKALYLDVLSAEAITAITEQVPGRLPDVKVIAAPLTGACCAVPDGGDRVGRRAPGVVIGFAAVAPEPALLAADRDWVASPGSGCAARYRTGQLRQLR